MTWIQSWIDTAYLGLERLLGLSSVQRYWKVSDLSEQLTAVSVAGFEIRVFCHERVYVRTYLNWRRWRRTYQLYRVFGQLSYDAPQALQTACQMDIELPRLRPWFVSDELQKQAAVAAYLDILIRKIKDDVGTYNPAV